MKSRIDLTAASAGRGPWPKTSLLVLLAITLAAETAADIGSRVAGYLATRPIEYEACENFCVGAAVEVTRDSCRCQMEVDE